MHPRMPELANVEPTTKLEPLFEIGRGGVAVVRAERLTRDDGTEQIVAVKRLAPLVVSNPETRDMFFAEARLAAMIHHPNVVRILDVGLDDDPFIAMDLILGESLSSLIAKAKERSERPLEAPLAAWVMAETCDALHAAHELVDPETGQHLHLVHRDVSPHNILLGFDGVARLTDFGIAKALGFGARTRTGEVKGKLPYMSPEQVMCDPMDRRSDLFSAGAVLFELVTGRRMWGDGNEVDVLRKLATEPIPKLADAWPEAPPELCALHTAMVARDPGQRPATACLVAESLRSLASLDRAEAVSGLSERMRELFPARIEELSQWLKDAKSSKQALPQAPARAPRKNRMTTLLTAAAALAAFAVALPVLNRLLFHTPQAGAGTPGSAASAPPPIAPDPVSSPAPVASSPAPALSSAPRPAPSTMSPAKKAPATTPSPAGPAPTPPPKGSNPVRTDKLDEHPF